MRVGNRTLRVFSCFDFPLSKFYFFSSIPYFKKLTGLLQRGGLAQAEPNNTGKLTPLLG